MGYWNTSCQLSGISLTEGTLCVGIPIVQSSFYESQWEPFGLPIVGEYNDYGSLENCDETNEYKYLIKSIDNKITEDFIGKKTSYCIYYKEDKYNESKGIDSLTRDSLYIKFNGKKRYLSMSFIIKDFYNLLVKESNIKELNKHDHPYKPLTQIGIDAFSKKEIHDLLLNKKLLDEEAFFQTETFKQYGNKLLELEKFKHSFSLLRKSLSPPIQSGSQHRNLHMVRKFNKYINKYISKYIKEYNETERNETIEECWSFYQDG